MKKALFVLLSLIVLLHANAQTDYDRYFPEITISQSNGPAPGYYMLTPIKLPWDTVQTPDFMMFVDNYGEPVYFHAADTQMAGIQVVGDYLYYSMGPRFGDSAIYKVDTMLNIVDTFHVAGDHPMMRLTFYQPDSKGHYLLLALDFHKEDLTAYGGKPDAVVKDFVVQEFDQNKNLVSSWWSKDHFNILDCDTSTIDITSSYVDYLHANALFVDSDTTFLVSLRHLNEICRVDRRTGEFVWRFGGKRNQFTFVNDTVGFNHQHSVRRLRNGDIVFLDNGNLHDPPVTSIVEYKLDEKNMTATLVRRIYHSPHLFVPFLGGVEELENGNILAYWGDKYPKLTEYFPNGEVALEMSYPKPNLSLRIIKTEWTHKVFVPSRDTIDFGKWDGYTESRYLLALHNNTDSIFKITGYATRTDYFSVEADFPVELPPHGDKDITVVYDPATAPGGYVSDVLTVQADYPHLYLAKQVFLEGRKEDLEPPRVTITPDTANVPPDAVVILAFSEPVRLTSGRELDYLNVDTLFRLVAMVGGTEEEVPFNATVTTDKMTVVLVPDDSLAAETTFRVIVPEGLVDYAGNALPDTSVSFSTGSEILGVRTRDEGNYTLWPNPASGILHLSFGEVTPKRISVYDLRGTLLLRKEKVRSPACTLDLSAFPQGLYLIVIEETATKERRVLKAVIRR